MVALNYQTPDRSMQFNQGKFRQNGSCGYILKPEFMFGDTFDPSTRAVIPGVEPVVLAVRVCFKALYKLYKTNFVTFFAQIIGARHLTKSSGRGIVSPFVEIEIAGVESDNMKAKTGIIRKKLFGNN